MSLSEKQKAFVREYLTDFNASRAAIAAGYSPKSAREQASKLLTKDNVRDAISQITGERSEKNEGLADRIINELKAIAFSDISDYFHIQEDGTLQAKMFEEIPKGATKAVKKIKQKVVREPSPFPDTEPTVTIYTELELYDKLKANELLGRHIGMFNDKKQEVPEAGPDPLLDAIGDSAASDWSESEDEPDNELTESDLPAFPEDITESQAPANKEEPESGSPLF